MENVTKPFKLSRLAFILIVSAVWLMLDMILSLDTFRLILSAFTLIAASISVFSPDTSVFLAYSVKLSSTPSSFMPISVIVLFIVSVFVTYKDSVLVVLSNSTPMSVTVPFNVSIFWAYMPIFSSVCRKRVDISNRRSSTGCVDIWTL